MRVDAVAPACSRSHLTPSHAPEGAQVGAHMRRDAVTWEDSSALTRQPARPLRPVAPTRASPDTTRSLAAPSVGNAPSLTGASS